MDRLTNIVWRDSQDNVVAGFTYLYKNTLMITNVTLSGFRSQVSGFTYDSLDRLTSESSQSVSAAVTIAYSYDLAGNRMSKSENGVDTTYTLGLGNRLASSTSADLNASFLHNSAGCVTNIQYAGSGYSENIGLSCNSQYQLTAISTNGVVVEENGYDPMGRRVFCGGRTVFGSMETNYFVYDGAHVLAEVGTSGSLVRSYTHGPGIDNWLSMTVYTGTTVKTYFYMTDHLGTVHAVADESGSIVESYRFDPWGCVLGVYNGSGMPLTESAIGNRFLWQGREYSWKTGLYFFRARWYDPITGRWLSNDPIGISGGLNQYVAFDNNPVNLRDPWGLFTRSELDGIRDRQLASHRESLASAIEAQNELTKGLNLKVGRQYALTSSTIVGVTATGVSVAWYLGAPGISGTIVSSSTVNLGFMEMTKITLGPKGAIIGSAVVTGARPVMSGANMLRGRTMDKKMAALEDWLQRSLDAANAALVAAQMAQDMIDSGDYDDYTGNCE